MAMAKSLTEQLRPFGAPAESVVTLESVSPEQLQYLDLYRLPRTGPGLRRPSAVVEMQGRPLLYVVSESNDNELPRLRRTLSFRADGGYLGVVEPGRLTIYDLASRGVTLPPALKSVTTTDANAQSLIPELALLPPTTESSASTVRDLLFDLLDHASGELRRVGISPDDALSLGGRALFLRFLIDRGVLNDVNPADVCAGVTSLTDALSNRARIARTSSWLDRTFNGGLLPLSEDLAPRKGAWFPLLDDAAMNVVVSTLTKILLRTEVTGQMRLDWGDINFAYVPVGLLSQVYERHNQRHDPRSDAQSVHYTPRLLVEYMVEESFSALDTPHAARVLDPAAGAGVFLVAAFRKLIAARWRNDKRRPNTATIREVLNKQLAGLEINESALRLAALSLYLTALELDPSPRPLEALRFDDLRGTVLFDVSEGASSYPRGSLGLTDDRHKHAYDLVIGNPPWTVLQRNPAYTREVLANLRPIVQQRLGTHAAATFTLPEGVAPDLAFFWRAMEWAKPGAQIALALHSRLLFKQTDVGRTAREQLFRSVTITGILNGAALRNTEVWPGVTAPFCLVFARNSTPTPDASFYFVSPELERKLNSRGRVRVDSKAARIVRASEVCGNPFLLKSLFRGTTLDVSLLGKLTTDRPALKAYWSANGLVCGKGFQVGGTAGAQSVASKLKGRACLRRKSQLKGIVIDSKYLDTFSAPTLLRTRNELLYQAPLVVLNVAPSPAREIPHAWLSPNEIIFTESFVGYSCHGHPQADVLAKYLVLLFNSDLWLYFALLTSSQYGVERDAVLKEDFDRFPFEPLESLSSRSRQTITSLFDGVAAGTMPLKKIDDWVAGIYGLNKWEQETIADTLSVSMPHVDSQQYAQSSPDDRRLRTFCERVTSELQPFLNRRLESSVRRGDPWSWLDLSCGGEAVEPSNDVTEHADELAATQIVHISSGRVRVGILNEVRYWTQTRARLLAVDFLSNEDPLNALQCD